MSPSDRTTTSLSSSPASGRRRRLQQTAPKLQALEQRMMFDGAAVVDAAAAATTAAAAQQAVADAAAHDSSAAAGRGDASAVMRAPASAATADSSVAQTSAATTTEAAPGNPVMAGSGPTAAPAGSGAAVELIAGNPAADGGRREIAFIDSSVDNWQALARGMRADVEVVLVDSSGDGLRQVADYLQGTTGVDAIHLLTHGQEGEAVLGTAHLNNATLADHQGDLSRIGAAMAPGGDLLLYGCSIGAGADGIGFIGQLARATGSDVAASSDATGSADHGGNWSLEVATGSIAVPVALSADGQAGYEGELALPGVHTANNSTGIFLGGNYIELGIRTNNSIGKFGADTSPGGAFTGRTNASNAAIAGIGMVGDADGFGTGAALNIDYFMPGTPEEGFYAGYKVAGTATTGKNFGSTVTDGTSGNNLAATVLGTVGSLKVSQVISFDVNDLFFKNTVTLTNTGTTAIDSVRFMRSFDPDNTVDKGGSYATVNTIEKTFAAGDGVAVVSAKSPAGDTYSTRSGGKQASILYYSSDSRARVSDATSGLNPSGIYDANIYDSAVAKGTTGTADAYISIAFDVGTLAAGGSTTITYYTSLDNRDINTILGSIAAADTKTLPAITEDPVGNTGATVSTVFGSAVAITAVDNSHGSWQYSANGGSSWSDFGSPTASNARLLSTAYTVRFVPNADYNGSSSLTYRVWNGSGYSAGGTADASSAGSNFSASTANANITISAVNDAPVLGGAAQTLNYVENGAAAAIDTAITVADVDAGAFAGGYLQAQITSNGAAEDQLSVLNQGSGAGQIGVSGSTVSFGGTAIGTIDTTLNGVNDAALKIVLNANASAAATQALARAIAYRDSSEAPSGATRTVSFTLNDGGNTGAGGALGATRLASIAVTPVNDPPVLAGAAQTLAYTENQAATAIDSVVTVADVDAANFGGGFLQAQLTANGAPEDQLSVLDRGTGAGQIGVSGSNVSYGGVVIGTLRAGATGSGTTALVIDLNTAATAAAVQALARSIGYADTSDNPSTAARTVTFTLNDGGNSGGPAASATRTATIGVTAVDDPTVLTLTRPTANYTENDGSFYVDAGLSLTDVDSTTMNGAKVVIAEGFNASQDRLQPTSGTTGGITYSYDSTKGVLTLTGSATIAQYEAALRAVKYYNTSDAPDTSARTITITLGNAVALNIGGVNHYYIAVNNTLDWASAKLAAQGSTFQGMTGYLATITSQLENDFITQKLSADAWIGASDDYNYINAAVGSTLYANQAASEGHWYWVTGPEKGTAISNGDNTPVTVAGGFAYWNAGEPNNSSSNENYAELYSSGGVPGRWNDLGTQSLGAYVIEYSSSAAPTFSKSLVVTPLAVNDAPVMTGSAPTLPAITEDAVASGGATVASFLSATDPDGTAVGGIAVTGLVSSRGTWQYSIDAGGSWAAVGTVSDSNALLLRGSDRLRFVPDAQNADTASFTYRAWDRSDENGGSIGAGSKTSAAVNGGTSAYSTGTQTASLSVTALNDAPVLTAHAPSLAAIDEDATNPAGTAVSTLLGSSVVDVDSGAASGIAISALQSGNGTWQYSIDNGTSWSAVGTVAANSALLLRSTDLVRFRPDGQNGTAASFDYKAWDRTTGSAGSKVDATVGGTTTAFSVASDRASVTVTSLNDAPVLSGAALAFAPITEDDTANTGQTVASLLNGTLSDVDAGAVPGVAVVGSSALAGTGRWQYSLDGSTWSDLGSVSASAAVLLRGSDRLRFLPDAQHGGTATLTLKGWDQSTGTAGGTANATTGGGSTAFSSASATATLTVTDLDDAPQITTPASAASFTENSISAQAVGSGIVVADDSGNLSSASVQIASGFTTGDILAVGSPGSLTVSYVAGVLTLSGNASAAVYQTALRSITFYTASDDPTVNAATRTLDWTVGDAAGNRSTVSQTTVTVTPLADAPVLGSVPGSWDYTEDDGGRIIAPSLTLADADDTRMSGATVTVTGTGYLNDGFETLSAVVTGTGITAAFDGSTGVLTLSGSDSAANYQKVLRSVTYTNSRDYNNGGGSFTLDNTTNARSFSWQVSDANSDGVGITPSNVPSTNVTLHDANEAPQVFSVVNNGGTYLSYTEGGAPATLEGAVDVHDDGVSSITSAFVRITTGLADGDQLGISTPPAGWTRTGTATLGSLDNGAGAVIDYSWSLATGTMAFTTHAGSTAGATEYTEAMRQTGFSSTSEDPTASGGSRTLIWRVTDSGGLESAVTSAQSTIIDITAINDTATVTALPVGGDVVFVEGGANVTLAPALTLVDPDDTTLAGATVNFDGMFLPSLEYLSLPGAATSAGSDWAITGFGGGSIDAHFYHSTGTLVLTGTASLADYQALLRQVAYGSVDPDPTATATTRDIRWTLTDSFGSRLTDADGGSNDSATGSAGITATSTVTFVPRNDAPVLTGLAGSPAAWTEGGSATVIGGGLGLSDADDALMSRATVRIANGYTAGDTLDASLGATGITKSFDATTGVLTLTGSASKADFQAVLASVRFSSSSADPTAVSAHRRFDWQVSDGNASGDGTRSSAIVQTTLDLTAVDTPSTVSGLPTGGSVSYTEAGSPAVLAPALALADGDDARLSGATVSIGSGLTTGDRLDVGALLTGTGISASYDPATGVLTLTGTASIADYQRALASVSFSNSGSDPTQLSASRTIVWQVRGAYGSRLTDASTANDATPGVLSTVASSNVTLHGSNNPPSIALDDGTSGITTDRPNYAQGAAPVYAIRIDNTSGGVSLADPDSADRIASASVAITAGHLASDLLSVATPAGWTRSGSVYSLGGTAITVAFNATTGVLSLSGVGSRAEYQTLLGSVQFANSSLAPTANGADREFTWSVTDTDTAGDAVRSASTTSHLLIADLNDPPSVTPATLSATYTEGDAMISLAGFTVADPDTGEIVTATVTLDHPGAGTLNTPAGSAYDPATGVWTFVGTVPAVNAALAALQFLPGTNNDIDTVLTLVVADGGENGAGPATAHFNLHVTAVNDAPVLTPAAPVLPSVTEDATSNGGFTVASFRGAISDVDTGAQTGIVLTGTTDGNGHWQYSLDGTTWLDVGAVDAGHALALRDTDKLRFVPDGANGTTGSLAYRAWDRSSGAAGSKLDATSTGNATAFSNASDTATIVVSGVNDAPVLTPAAAVLPTITEDATGNTGFTVASFRGAIADPDTGALNGIVVTGTTGGNGSWQYSLDGTTWNDVGAVDDGHALALRDTSRLRFVPDGNNGTAASLTYRAWDRSSGSSGTRLDASVTGGSTAFSVAADTATLIVTGVNDAPVLMPAAPALAAITEDATGNAGYTVASFRGAITDPDAGAQTGIVLTGTTDGNGHWQYSLDGTTWLDVGAVDAGHALALRDSDKLRFVPGGQNPTSATFDYRAWDRTSGIAGARLDATTTGGTSAFSTASDTASLDVLAVNDAPVMSAASPVLPTIDEDALANTGIGIGALIGSSVTDPDDGAQRGIAITSTSLGGGRWQYSLDGGSTWADVGSVSEGAARLLRETDRVRLLPDGANAAAPTFSYRAWDGTTGAAGGQGDARLHGGSNAYSDGLNTAHISVTAVNDAPVLTPAVAVLPTLTEDATANAGFTVASFRGAIADPDSGAQPGIVLTGTADGNGHWQYSLDGTTWLDVGAVDAGHALALRDTDKLRFVPDGANATTGALTYRAWDQSVGSAGNKLDATVTGNASAYSSASDTATIGVTAVNDAPVLTPAATVLPTLTEDATANAGFTVASFRGAVADSDTGAQPGIVLTGTADGNGHWQYSLNGTTWLDVGAVDAGHALALRDTDKLRFVPDGANATTGALTYRAWDQSVGSAGNKLDATVTGNASAYSSASDTATIGVTAVNDAPVLTPAGAVLPTLTEDATANAGFTVASFRGAVADSDTGAQPGIVLTGTNDGNGHWQYSLDGTTWLDVGAVDAGHALALRDTDKLRFVPDGANATTGALTYRAWDQSVGSAGNKLDATVTGNASAYSSASDTATIGVTAVNDAPVLTPAATVLPTLTEDATANAGFTVASFRGAVADSDTGAQPGIVLTGTADGNGHWQYSLNGTTWLDVGAVDAGHALALRDTDKLRFVPDAMNGTTGSLTYRAWDQSVGSAGNKLDATVTGAASAYSSASDTATIGVTAVNDAPVNDAAPATTGALRADGSVRQDGTLTATPGLWHDVDTGAVAPTYAYQWQVADDAAGTHLRSIDGATASQLLLSDALVGKYVRVQVIASDGVGPSLPAYGAFQHVTNDDPTAGSTLASPRATEAVPYSYTVPADAFDDRNGEDTLHYKATLADGSPLPGWLSFDPATRTFSGTPTGRDIASLDIKVTADDLGGHASSQTFRLDVAGVPAVVPVVTAAVGDSAAAVTAPPAKVSTATSTIAPFGSGGIATGDTFGAGTAGAGAAGAAPSTVAALTGSLGIGGVPGMQGLPSGTLGPVVDGGSGNPMAAVLAVGDAGGRSSGATVGGNLLAATAGTAATPSAPATDTAAGTATATATAISTATAAATTAAGSGTGATADASTTAPGRGSEAANSALATAPTASARSEAASVDRGYTRPEGFRAVVPQASTAGDAVLTVSNLPSPQLLKPAQAIDYTLASDTFTHTRTDAVISLTAKRSDGAALPGWMTFNARDGKFSGTPPADFEGTLEMAVTATDNFGNAQTVLVRIVVKRDDGLGRPQGKAGLSTQLRLARSAERSGDRVATTAKLARRA